MQTFRASPCSYLQFGCLTKSSYSGYYPFTSAVGGQTPCWSSANTVMTAPDITTAIPSGAATVSDSNPTSAVVNIVWSMQYTLSGPSSGLSTGAIAGIAVGAALAVILIAVLGICLWRSKRKARRLAQQQNTAPGAPAMEQQQQQQQYQQQYQQPYQTAEQMQQQQQYQKSQVMENVQPQMEHGQLYPGTGVTPSDRTSFMTSQTVSSPSPLMQQSTGASGATVSEASWQSNGALLGAQAGGYGNGNGNGQHPGAAAMAPLPEMNEAHAQYNYHNQQQQQQQAYPQQEMPVSQDQHYYSEVSAQSPPVEADGFYPPQQQAYQNHQAPAHQVHAPSEMSARREEDPAQEVA
jgi:hypothetical protein